MRLAASAGIRLVACALSCCTPSTEVTVASGPTPSPPGESASTSASLAVTASPSGAPSAKGTSTPATRYLAKEGTKYTFRVTFRGRTKDDVPIELRGVDADGERVLYFATHSGAGLIAPVVGMGALVQRAGGLYTADVLVIDELTKLSRNKLSLLLAAPPVVGAAAEVNVPATSIVPGKRERYQVDGIETVTVPAGTFADCIKLSVQTVIDGEAESSTVWLAPGIGPVKLVRATGRVDELAVLALAP